MTEERDGRVGLRLGIDMGGTFTDAILVDEGGAVVASLKTPSIPASPAQAIFNTIDSLATQGFAPAAIRLFVHGTTLAVNTLIERNGAATGLLVTRGFRDLLEIRRLRLENTTDFYGDKPLPLVPRHLVKEINERVLADGGVLEPLDQDQLRAAVRELVDQGVRAVAICFLHAYTNGDHERLARRLIHAEFPELFACTSAEIWPQQREYERGLVTVMNAYIGDQMARYLRHLEAGVAARGLQTELLSTKSNGGVMTVARAAQEPVQTLLSGPASGVIGAAYSARLAGFSRVVTLDMGGTSADVAVVDGEPSYSTENLVGDFPVIMPAIDVTSIGAGGGSIAWIDPTGILKVGPQSAAADPGPACYGRGGDAATVTDAYVQLGIIAPDRFLGGQIRLLPERADAALARLGAVLKLDASATAQAILDVATSNMYAQFTPLMARKGVDPRDFVLLAYGGAGPTHAFLFAREVGMRRILIPPTPGTLCALGCIVADLRHDVVRTLYRTHVDLLDAELEDAFADLEARARDWLAGEVARGITLEQSYVLCSADMRYEGQAFEIDVPIPGERRGSVAETAALFHARYMDIFGVNDPDTAVTFVNLRATVVGVTAKVRLRPPARDAAAHPREHRRIFYDGQMQDAQVVHRAALGPAERLEGPAVVEQYDTTTFIPRGFSVRSDAGGNLVGEAV
jgi:N-methylhydantoinase A